MENKVRYSLWMRLLHWLMALLIIGMLAVGLYMTSLDPQTNPEKAMLYAWHKSFGVVVLILIVVRFVTRQRSWIPPLPPLMPNLQKFVAKGAHYALYLLMLLMPLSGYAMSNLFGHKVALFGLDLPVAFAKNPEWGMIAKDFHEIGANAFLIVLAMHIGGALYHRFLDRDNDVLPRMV